MVELALVFHQLVPMHHGDLLLSYCLYFLKQIAVYLAKPVSRRFTWVRLVFRHQKGVSHPKGVKPLCLSAVTGYNQGMPRPPRADEAGGIYHALNRANMGAPIFKKEGDFVAFEKVLHEALSLYQVELYSFQLMTNHWHLILRPLVDGEMGRFCKWVGCTHTMRYHAHYGSAGRGHLYQGRFKSFPIQDDEHFLVACRYVERNALRAKMTTRAEDWRWGSLWRWLQRPEPNPQLLSPWPIPRLPNWVSRVNEPLSQSELKAIRNCAKRGTPLGDEGWVESIARRLNLESTMRPRGRPRVRPLPDNTNKEV